MQLRQESLIFIRAVVLKFKDIPPHETPHQNAGPAECWPVFNFYAAA